VPVTPIAPLNPPKHHLAIFPILYQPPPYMLVKMLRDPNSQIRFANLPSSVLPIKPTKFQHNYRHGRKAKVKQFPVTLAYAITTDYKCQGKAFQYVIVDLKKSSRGSSPHTSAYV
jgi:hypothetical protein